MSAQTIFEAFLPVEAHYRAQIQKETWGHLAPRANAKYSGHVIFALGCFGSDHLNPTPIECAFTSRSCGGLDDSPWFYDTLIDFLHAQTTEPGIYRFDGYFRDYEFSGCLTKVAVGE